MPLFKVRGFVDTVSKLCMYTDAVGTAVVGLDSVVAGIALIVTPMQWTERINTG